MRITEEEFKRAGRLEEGSELGVLKEKFSHSDQELTLIIKAKRLAIAYLEGRGYERWWLAIKQLQVELWQLEDFVIERKRG